MWRIMATKILHTGDTHLGYKQYNKDERKKDFTDAFQSVVDIAIEEDVDAVIHAGDLFHRSRPDADTINDALTILRQLEREDIDFLMVVGNHDSTRNKSWSDIFDSLGLANSLGLSPTTVDDIAFYGQDFIPRSRRSELSYDFAPSETSQSVLVAHGLFQPFPHGDWDLNEILASSPVGFDLALLGDDHTHQTETVKTTTATYCGSTERTSADQREARAVNIISFDDGSHELSRHPITTRTFTYVDVEMPEDGGMDDIKQELNNNDIPDGAVVVVTIMGEGDRIPPRYIEDYIVENHSPLVVTVNDRRDFGQRERVDREVSFSDPDKAVEEQKRTLDLLPMASDLESLSRNTTEVTKSNIREESKGIIEERIESGSYEDAEKINTSRNENRDKDADSGHNGDDTRVDDIDGEDQNKDMESLTENEPTENEGGTDTEKNNGTGTDEITQDTPKKDTESTTEKEDEEKDDNTKKSSSSGQAGLGDFGGDI